MTQELEPALAHHLALREDALARVRRVLVTSLRLALEPDQIELDAPLFGTGLGLDSVDAVELVVAIETEFGFQIPEGAAGPWALRTVHSLVEFVLDSAEAAPMSAELPPEIDAIRTRAALARHRTTRAVRVRGEGARDTVRWVLPSRLHLRDAQARQSLLLDESGRPIADVIVCGDDEDYLLLIDGPIDPIAHLRPLLRNGAELEDLDADHEVIDIHGPWAWELVGEVLGSDFVALPYLNFFRIEGGYCVRAGRTGEYGYHLVVRRADADALYVRFLEKGRELDAIEVSADAVALCGFENWFFDPEHVPAGATPVELQLMWRLAFDRDYLGRAAIDARRRASTRRQVCLISETAMAVGEPVTLGARAIGEVTRAAFSHARGEFFASALIERELAHGGIDRFRVAGRRARTVAPPLLDNRSLYVDPRRHAYRTRDEVVFHSLVRRGGAAIEPA